jgi:hypothetical protein
MEVKEETEQGKKRKLPGDVSTPPFPEAVYCKKENHSQAERLGHRKVCYL